MTENSQRISDNPDARADAESRAADDAAAVRDDVPGRDGGPIDEDDMRAAEGLTPRPEVEDDYGEIIAKAAHTDGEGRIP